MNGLGFEGADFKRAVNNTKNKVIIASEGIHALKTNDDHKHGHAEVSHHGHEIDPHAFTDPILVKNYVRNIAKGLIAVDPSGKAYYQNRLDTYLAELTELDNWIKQTFNDIPKVNRKVLTAHDAFSYFGKQYNIEFIAPQGVNTQSEASAKTVASIVKQAKAQNIKAVFSENIKNAQLINQISKESGINIKGKLYSDALSKKNGEADTYIKMVKFNVVHLKEAMK